MYLGANFTSFPEVVAGGTLGSPEAEMVEKLATPAVTEVTPLSVGAALVNAVAFSDKSGTIAANKGVISLITGGTRGETYLIYLRATISGDTPAKTGVRQRAVYLKVK